MRSQGEAEKCDDRSLVNPDTASGLASVCAPPIGAFVIERLGYPILHSSRISLCPPLPPVMCTYPISVRTARFCKAFSSWNQCSFVLSAPGMLTLSRAFLPCMEASLVFWYDKQHGMRPVE